MNRKRKTQVIVIVCGVWLFIAWAAFYGHYQKRLSREERDRWKEKYNELLEEHARCITTKYYADDRKNAR